MKKQLQQINNKKTKNCIMPILFTLSVMLASMMGMAQTAYITAGDNVYVINVATNTVIHTIAGFNYPYGVSVSPDGSKVYITNDLNGIDTVSVINTATNTVVAAISVGYNPSGVAVSPDGSKVYVTHIGDNTVRVIDATADTVSATITLNYGPKGIAISPDGSQIYVGESFLSNKVYIINTATNTISGIIQVGTNPQGIAVIPDGSKVYVASGSDTVSVANTTTNTVSATIIVGSNPCGIAISPDGSKVYVTNNADSTVSVINAATNIVMATITVGSNPLGVSVSPDGSKVYVANNGSNTVSVINTATNTVLDTIPVGLPPIAFGNFISTYTARLCGANFSIKADTNQLHHYLVSDSSFGKQPFKHVWSWGDGSQDTIQYPTHTYADSGFYNICLSITDSSGCQSTFCDSSFHALRTTNTMVYVSVVNPLVTGTKEVSLQTPEIFLYPNPAANQLTIHRSAFHNEVVMAEVMNMLGQVTSPPTPLRLERGNAVIDVSGLPSGMYFLQMKAESGSVVKKFVKE